MKDVSLIFYLHSLKLSLSSIELLNQWPETKFLKHKILTDLENLGYTYDGEITPKGVGLLFDVNNWVPMENLNKLRKSKALKKGRDPKFQEWLDEYPKSPNFEIGGKMFVGTRSLQVGLDKAEVVYQRVLEEGKITHLQLIECLKKEVEMRKSDSLRKNSNELQYMKAVPSYLSCRNWEIYLSLLGKDIDKGDRVKMIKNMM